MQEYHLWCLKKKRKTNNAYFNRNHGSCDGGNQWSIQCHAFRLLLVRNKEHYP
jgi:hypothetical protein